MVLLVKTTPESETEKKWSRRKQSEMSQSMFSGVSWEKNESISLNLWLRQEGYSYPIEATFSSAPFHPF